MNITRLSIVFTFLSAATLYVLYQKISQQSALQANKPCIVCTTTIIANSINQIAGDSIQLETLMGPGVDPHVYKPIEADFLKIAKADLIMYHGLHLEARMVDLFEHMATIKPTVAVTKDIPAQLLISSNDDHTIFDPHVWFDPELWIQVATTIETALSNLLPEHAHTYRHNRDVFINQIQQMHQATKQQLSKIPAEQKIVVTSHDAFSYFARTYGFKVVSLQGINTVAQEGLRDLQDVVDIILRYKIPTIFIESSVPPRSMQAIQQQVAAQGGHVAIGQELLSDSLAPANCPGSTYLEMLSYNSNAILDGLIKKI
jgi:manganese/zinc/iron transport system substrate-binding protein